MKRSVTLIAISALLAGCGGVTNGTSYAPVQTVGNTLQSSKIQLAVGTAHLPDGTTGLNIVTTFRQTNGLTAALVNTPSITAPNGFVVPTTTGDAGGSGGSGTDGGTNSITALPQTFQKLPALSAQPTFGVVGGDFASGLANLNNATNSKSLYFPGNTSNGVNPAWGEPFYASATQPYIVGPPAVPFFNDGSYPSGFAGYMTGFTAFEAKPVSGTYTLTDTVATSNAGTPTFTATATLSNLTPLGAVGTPTFTSDAKGGGSGAVSIPAGATETLVYVADTKTNTYYTVGPITGTGTQPFTLPDTLGTCGTPGTGCTRSASLNSGDTYVVYAASFDYPQFEAEPPGNLSQTPTLTTSGQADVSMSPVLSGTY